MPTMITVTCDDQKDADVITQEIANHMAGRGFKNVHYETTEEKGQIFNYAQEQLQAMHDASVEDGPSLLDLMRLSRPEFFETEDVEVRSEPSVFEVAVPAQRIVADELVSDIEMPGFKSRTTISEKIWKDYQNNPDSLTPEERSLARYAESEGMTNIKVTTF